MVINNGSPDKKDYEGNLGWWQKKVDNPHTIRYHVLEENIGFGGVMNLGAKHAKGDILVFFSDDVIISGNFLPILNEKLVGYNLVGGEMIDFPTGWNEFEIDGKKIYIPYLNGWILATEKSGWEKSGGFDPIYFPFDFEDVDLSTRYVEMGYNLVALNSPYLRHIGGATILSLGYDRAKHTMKHKQLYYEKWKGKLLQIYEKQEGQQHERQ